jgi:hypothetical protein
LWRRYALGDVANQHLYTLPEECTQIERVEWNNYRIHPSRAFSLTHTYPGFESITGDMTSYVMEGDGLRVIRRVPGAASTDPTKFVIEYIRRGAELISTITELEIPDRYAIYVRFFALWQALRRDGPGRDLKLATHFKARYDQGVARCLDRKSRARSLRTGVFGGGSTRPSGPPPRPQLPWNFPSK